MTWIDLAVERLRHANRRIVYRGGGLRDIDLVREPLLGVTAN